MTNERHINPFAAVIFDLDGLVLDTETSYFTAWKQAAAAMGCSLSDEFCLSLSGLQYQDVVRRIQIACAGSFELETFNRLSAECWRKHIVADGIAVKEGFFDMLQLVRDNNLPFCLATNSQQHYALECLRHAGLERVFPLIAARDTVARGKPEPDLFYRAAQLLHQPLSACLILEDSPIGVAAASRTEAQLVFIPSVLPADAASIDLADFVFSDLRHLAEFIRLSDYDHV